MYGGNNMDERILAVQRMQDFIEENPKIQLEPIGERGYIELHPIK